MRSTTPTALDVETGGTDPHICALLSIGAYANGKSFYVEICPPEGLIIEEQALQINGLDPRRLRETGVSEKEALQRLFVFLAEAGDATLLGQNPSFDASFIRAACRRNGLDCPLGYRSIDLHAVAATLMAAFGGYPVAPIKGHPGMARTDVNLDTILGWAGMEKRTGAHNALEDARLTYDAWTKIVQSLVLVRPA